MRSQEKQVPIPPNAVVRASRGDAGDGGAVPARRIVASSSRSTKSRPGRTAPARSGWVGSMPESTIAMTTRGEPVVSVPGSREIEGRVRRVATPADRTGRALAPCRRASRAANAATSRPIAFRRFRMSASDEAGAKR